MKNNSDILTTRVVEFLESIGIDVSFKRFTNDNVQIRCPFATLGTEISGHQHLVDSNPSLGIKITTDGFMWNCFTCHRKGRSFISFVNALQKYNLVKDSVDAYAIQNSVKVSFPDYYEQWIDNPSDEKIIDLSKFVSAYQSKAVREYHDKIRKAKGSSNYNHEVFQDCDVLYSREMHQIIFPQYDCDIKDIPVGYVEHYINGRKPKYNNNFDTGSYLFLEWMAKGKIGIIIEGMYDTIKVYQHLKSLDMLKTHSAVGMFGSEVSSIQINKIVRLFHTIIIMGDNDDAGIGMEKRIYFGVRRKMPLIFRLRYNGKDPDQVTLKQFERIIKSPTTFRTIA